MPRAFLSKRRLYGRFSMLAASALLVAACTYEHSRQKTAHFLRQSHLITNYQIERSDNWVLSGETPVCLVAPGLVAPGHVAPGLVDPGLEAHAVLNARPRAHQHLHQALHEALAQHFAVVQVPRSSELTTTAQASALRGCSVMIMPHIMQSQDQLNSWKEIHQDLGVFPHRHPGPDTLVVRVAIYSVVGVQPLDIATVHGRTGVWTLDGRTPADMFDNAMQAYVVSISNKPHAS